MENRSGFHLEAGSRQLLLCVAACLALELIKRLGGLNLFAARPADHASIHLLLELISSGISVLVAVMAWHSLSGESPGTSRLFVFGFSSVAALDVLHALSYEGMPSLLTDASTNKAIFFWLCARGVEVATVLAIASGVVFRGGRALWLGLAVLLVLAVFVTGTLHLGALPALHIPGVGVTPLKTQLEYLLFAANMLAAAGLLVKSRGFPGAAAARSRTQLHWLATASFVTGVGELAFTNYMASTDFVNMAGHGFKIVAYLIIYRTVFHASVTAPYEMLEQSRAELGRRRNELSTLLSNLPIELLRFDPQLRCRYANPAYARRVEREPSALIGGGCREVLPAAWVDPVQERLAAAAAGSPVEFDFSFAGRTGEARYASAVVVPEYAGQGRLEGVLAMFVETTDRRRAEEVAQRMALFDPLTGLANRRLMLDRLHQEQSSSGRSGQFCALVLLDLDNFREINDTLGHDLGDELLHQVSLRIRDCLPEPDQAARMGGDEFAILFGELGPDARAAIERVGTFAEGLRTRLASPFVFDEAMLASSASIGIVMFRGVVPSSEDLLKQADLALYRAKALGRNRVCFFDPSLQTAVIEQSRLLADLRKAVSRSAFLLHYQAVVDAQRRVLGHEALIRWHHEERGWISPADFIPVAERSGLILEIGLWVLRTGCEKLAAWGRDEATASWTLSVNVSARQVRDPGFVDKVAQVLRQTGADPALLRLELTESMLHDDVEGTIEKMSALRALGIRFSLDDFGTGYSSLSYIKRMPLDQLKIDRSFVHEVVENSNDAAIAKTILALAATLDLHVVSEGVETEAQFEFLRAQGCDAFQGYLFGRPQPL